MKHLTRNLIVAGTVALSLGVGATASKAQEFINVLTGGTSGVYYPLGAALAKIYGDKIEGVKTQVQSTKASVENLNLLQQGRGEIAFALGDSVKSAWEGDGEAGFPQKLEKLRAIAAIYPNYIQIVASQESGIKEFADLKGKSLSVGAPKSGTELNARRIFQAMGMSYDDLGKTEYLPFGESVELIKNRQLDATLQSAGLGVASIKDLSVSLPITMVSVPGSGAAAPFSPRHLAGTYEGQSADVPTLAITNILVTHSDVSGNTPDDQTALRNLDEMVAAHAAAKASARKRAQWAFRSAHPGMSALQEEKALSPRFRRMTLPALSRAGIPRDIKQAGFDRRAHVHRRNARRCGADQRRIHDPTHGSSQARGRILFWIAVTFSAYQMLSPS